MGQLNEGCTLLVFSVLGRCKGPGTTPCWCEGTQSFGGITKHMCVFCYPVEWVPEHTGLHFMAYGYFMAWAIAAVACQSLTVVQGQCFSSGHQVAMQLPAGPDTPLVPWDMKPPACFLIHGNWAS